jgi:6,7-dimethyl-8-ribityllumazine synthase
MIVSLTTHYVAANKKDFDVLQRILIALGVWRGRPRPRGPKGTLESFVPSRFDFQLTTDAGKVPEPDFCIHVSEPLLAFQIVKQSGGKTVAGLSDEEIASRGFRVKLPSGAIVQVAALLADPDDAELRGLSGNLDATGKRFGIVVARFNSFISERLLQGAFDGLLRAGAVRDEITIVRVPGAFEIPSAARTLAETKKFDAILCIGCLLRGDTAHYDVIVNEVTRGIGQSAQETGVPHAFGVLTCDTLEQAIDRAGLKMGNKGLEAALAAVEMANLRQALGQRAVQKVPGKKSAKKNSARKVVRQSRRKKN